jgi:hypothetical protein
MSNRVEASIFSLIDNNSDGEISPLEYISACKRLFIYEKARSVVAGSLMGGMRLPLSAEDARMNFIEFGRDAAEAGWCVSRSPTLADFKALADFHELTRTQTIRSLQDHSIRGSLAARLTQGFLESEVGLELSASRTLHWLGLPIGIKSLNECPRSPMVRSIDR